MHANKILDELMKNFGAEKKGYFSMLNIDKKFENFKFSLSC